MSATDETEEAAPKARSFYLACSLPRGTVRIALDEGREVSFGRSDGEDVDVVIDDAQVSRRHAVVVRTRTTIEVRDLGSRNGTTVSGEPLRGAARRVEPGDAIEIGPMTIVVAAESARFVVADAAMRKLLAAAQRVARRKSAVSLLGEPGVGKALLAEWIHDASARADAPFVRVDCRALPNAESELFGERGLVATARGGTLFVNEIGALPLGAQARLFDALPSSDARLVCSSTSDLRAAMVAGLFHRELHALVGTISLELPPLRQRRTEIPVLAEHLLRRIAQSLGAPEPTLSAEAAALLASHSWPRNVSDLRDVLEVAFALSDDGRVTPAELPVAFAHDDAERAQGQRVTVSLARSGESFSVGGSREISLARRGPLRRILLCLAQHQHAPVSGDELFAAGWPGEKPVGQSAEGRLRTAIWTLRRLGLRELLVTRDDGYHLGADVVIAWRA
jgi:transcriptional regulator of acetoin/glycerol metabolism